MLACATVGLTAASCDDTPAPGESPQATGGQVPAAPVKGAQAPGGGGLKVVESGVSMTTDGRGDTMATYGLLLENTSRDHLAYDAEISVTMLDASGQPVSDRLEKSTRVTKTLRFSAPQQRVGLGQYVYVDRGRAVTSLKVEIGESWWLPASAARIAPLTTSGVTATTDDVVHVRFTVDNGYPVPVKRVAMALLRDAAGAIVGGTGPDEAQASLGDFPPGRSPGEIESIGGAPAGVDLGRTEVYVYPTPEAFRAR
ncbi:hypothetical protein ACTMTJ_25820 [Phytohabitans sp. LJ34]|uniref:hypothetical protein n=1 Tax=Phytohabitans sp. LJ34 TaxID=3452217 RepID=UPI003F8B22B2